jgi:hypothetical protein
VVQDLCHYNSEEEKTMSKKIEKNEVAGLTVAKDVTIKGDAKWFTCKTGTGKDRFCVRVTGKATVKDASGEREVVLSAQCFDDWDGKLPANLAAVVGNSYTDPETGLHRSVKGAIEGTVQVPAGTPVTEQVGSVVTFYQVDVSVDAFNLKATGRKFIEFK